MRTTLRTLALASAAALAGAGWLADRPAQAQNTYADVPFNQGSLFYRPSGARPPATTTTTTTTTRRANRRFFRRGQRVRYAAPARVVAPGYQTVAPATPYYYYPTAR